MPTSEKPIGGSPSLPNEIPSALPSRLRLQSAIFAAVSTTLLGARILQQREPIRQRVLAGELRQLVDHRFDREIGGAGADAAPRRGAHAALLVDVIGDMRGHVVVRDVGAGEHDVIDALLRSIRAWP